MKLNIITDDLQNKISNDSLWLDQFHNELNTAIQFGFSFDRISGNQLGDLNQLLGLENEILDDYGITGVAHRNHAPDHPLKEKISKSKKSKRK